VTVGDVAEVLSAATGMVLSTYTGVLLGATAIPVWSRNARVLPLHFGASGLGTAVSMLELLSHRSRALNTIGIGTAVVETALAINLETNADPVLAPIKEGHAAPARGRSSTARRLAAASTIAGSILTRVAWVNAGK